MLLFFVLVLCQASAPTPTARAAAVPSPAARRQFRIPTVRVHRAYVYPHSASWQPRQGHKLVAIDLDFRNIDAGFDLDDVQLLESPSDQPLEAAAEAAFLHPDGRFFAWRRPPPSGIRRVLLVFEIPSMVTAVRIRLWDDILTPAPITFAPSGPALPPERPGA